MKLSNPSDFLNKENDVWNIFNGLRIRPFAIGRKNWLFSHSVHGAQASATLYSLIATAKENDLHVEEYLNDLFFQLPILNKSENPDYTPLLPWNWNK